MENSVLVQEILKNAFARKEEIKNLTDIPVDLLVVGVLEVLSDDYFGMLPSSLSSDEEAMEELAETKKLLEVHTKFWDMVLFDIMALFKTDYIKVLKADQLSLGALFKEAEKRILEIELGEVTADVLVKIILENPTPAVERYIFGKMDAQLAPKEGENDDLFDLFFDEDDEDEQKDEDEPEKEQGLSGLVTEAKELKASLLEHVFGQDHAINVFITGYFHAQLAHRIKKDPNKPKATFLFAGPPGTGKTFLSETVARLLKLPFARFDMSEYSEKEANLEFCGSDKVYKGAKAGNVTSFVAENPKCVLLFDEVEKAHINVIHLFLQMLDAGRLRDNYTDEEVSFADAIIILTTNAGKNLYNDLSIANLSALPRKQIMKALAADKGPSGNQLFPEPICSRFASGNVVMFNHLGASALVDIARNELAKNIDAFNNTIKKPIALDKRVPAAIMMAEGGKADARAIKGRANGFFHDELYELFRLVEPARLDLLEKITIKADIPDDEKIKSMFENSRENEVLVFATGKLAEEICAKVRSVKLHIADTIDDAKKILFENRITAIVCDVRCKMRDERIKLLNAEDIDSVGQEFLEYAIEKHPMPTYIIQKREGDISAEELFSFSKLGVRDVLTVRTRKKNGLDLAVKELCEDAYRQSNMLKLASENKVMSFKTSQSVSKDGKRAEIRLFGFTLSLAPDTGDSKQILDGGVKPKVRFDDVIGAEDAKDELRYFVNYLKDPVSFMKKGARAPRGILLYGPPGTGKTLLAKAMAGESDVTFMPVDGNSFLKRFVGEGPETVHALFASARKYAPAVVFIDEIDAIAKDRNANTSTTNAEASTLTAFLTEMDGFNTDTSKPVFILAATNFNIDPKKGVSLDPALLRRFDRKILVDLPNKEEREKYLRLKLPKYPIITLTDDEIENIATRSSGMSLADLESVIEFALRNAIKGNATIGDKDFEEAFETFNGGEKRLWSTKDLEKTARHEAGHTLIYWLSGNTPAYVTIVSRGDHGGYMQRNEEEKSGYTRRELLESIRCSLGGRGAELVYYGDEDGVSTGASSDIKNATRLAQAMICHYGMDEEVGLISADYLDKDAEYQSIVRRRINQILSEQLAIAKEQIAKNRVAVDELVKVLLETNYLKASQINEILEKYAVK